MNKGQFIEKVKQADEKISADNIRRKMSDSTRLQKKLSAIGVDSRINKDSRVVVADDYSLSEGTNMYGGTVFRLTSLMTGDCVKITCHSVDNRLVTEIGRAITKLDNLAKEVKNEPEPVYTFSGDTLGEIMEQVFREMIAEETNW